MRSVLLVALRNEHLFDPTPRSPWWRWRLPARRPRAKRPPGSSSASATLLPAAAAILGLILVSSVVVFAVALHKNPVDALYFAVTTALGNSTLDERGSWLKIFGVTAMVAGGALLGVLFSYLASVATAHRIEERMGRQAQRLSGHAVVAGLGTVGYRVVQLLQELGVPCAAVDMSPNPRFLGALGEHTPVLTGDVRLPESLGRAGIAEAVCLFALTDDDLTNIEACLQAQRLRPGIRTIARVYDEALAERMRDAFGIEAISASRVTAASFVGAAVDERAARSFRAGPIELHAFRHEVITPVQAEEVAAWAGRGVHVLAIQHGGDPGSDGSRNVDAAGAATTLQPGDSVIVAGPPRELQEVLG
jgi:Trk K+ transport system NAD-binding subunit